MRWPVSVKGVVFDERGHVLLGLNDRDEWELLGGRLEQDESPEEAVRREIHEESGLDVVPRRLVRTWRFEPTPDAHVFIVTYGCELVSGIVRNSHEHSRVQFHDICTLDTLALPAGYRTDIDSWWLLSRASRDQSRGHGS